MVDLRILYTVCRMDPVLYVMSSVWEARLQFPDKREEACHKTHTHTHTHHNSNPGTLLTASLSPLALPSSSSPNPHHTPAKLTAPSSVENESCSHYNRAGQIPLALSEIERKE